MSPAFPQRTHSLSRPRRNRRAVGHRSPLETTAAIGGLEQLERRELFAVSPIASVDWSTYFGSTNGGDSITSAWVIPATPQNGYGANGDLVVVNYNGQLKGIFTNTLNDSRFADKLVGTKNAETIAQYQVSEDGTRLYVAGTTRTPGWAINGFDTSVGLGNVKASNQVGSDEFGYDFRNNLIRLVQPTQDGFFSSFDMTNVLPSATAGAVTGQANYVTYVGADGEINASKDPYWLNGRDYINSFYVDPRQPEGTAYVAGTSKARIGNATVPADSGSFIDTARDFPEYAQSYDGILYSLKDRPHAPGSDQLNWKTYLSPTTPPTAPPTDDGDVNLDDYIWGGNVQSVDFVWSAHTGADGTGDKLIFMLGKVRASNINGASTVTRIVTMNETQLLNYDPTKATAADRRSRLEKWVNFQDFTYADPIEKIVVNQAARSDGSGTKGPAVFMRYGDMIRKIDLPRDGDVQFTATAFDMNGGAWSGWSKTFDTEIAPTAFSVAPNGERFYIASRVDGYSWSGYPQPAIGDTFPGISGGTGRSGGSDVAILEYNVAAPQANWMMLQGGDGTETPTALAALSDGTVLLMGTTDSKPSTRNPLGWIPSSETDPTKLGDKRRAPVSTANTIGLSTTFRGGTNDGFIVAIKTSNKVASKSEIDVGGVVNATYVPVASGTTAASTVTGTDFGRSAISGAGNERTFRIRNLGTEPLTFTAPQLIIPSWLALKSGSTLPATLAAGASADITFVVKTQTLGSYTGTVQILSNDADEGTYSFSVKAAVITPPPSTFSVAALASSVTEGNTGTTTASFTVTLTPGDPLPTYPLTVRYATQGVSATAGQDFVAIEQGTLTFNQGETTKTVTVTVNGDSSAEPDETFKLVLSAPSQGIISSEAAEATVMIANDDGEPLPLTIGFMPATVRVTEGNSGTRMAELTVGLNQASSTDVTVQYATANLTATAGSDYANSSGTLLIAAGSIQRTIQIPIWGDTAPEADEVFTVTLSDASAGAEITSAAASVTIANDDGAPRLPAVRVSKPSVIEGNSGSPKLSFVISLAKAVSTTTVLSVATVDGTAKAGKDYLAYAGNVTIPAGRSSATVTVNVIPNRTVDGNRTLSLRVSNGGTIVATGIGTIRDDDRAKASASRPVSQFAMAAAFAAYGPTTTTAKKK